MQNETESNPKAMTTKTDAPDSSPSAATPAESSPAAPSQPERPKLNLGLFIATVGGLGDIPLGPGTFGSFAGLLIYALTQGHFAPDIGAQFPLRPVTLLERLHWACWTALPVTFVLIMAGLWASSRAAKLLDKKDPQSVVIDEVSGQHLAFTLALAPMNWHYLVLGLILFRAFDIWKPFPARQAESLPGGWGIMTDDWVAGIYTAILLWIARAAGL
jgi:phosphatidylglycerophosphatase A